MTLSSQHVCISTLVYEASSYRCLHPSSCGCSCLYFSFYWFLKACDKKQVLLCIYFLINWDCKASEGCFGPGVCCLPVHHDPWCIPWSCWAAKHWVLTLTCIWVGSLHLWAVGLQYDLPFMDNPLPHDCKEEITKGEKILLWSLGVKVGGVFQGPM